MFLHQNSPKSVTSKILDNKTSQTRDQVWSSQPPKFFLSHSQSTQARLALKNPSEQVKTP